MKFLLNILLKIRETVQSFLNWIYEGVIDKESGKLKFISPKNFKKFLFLMIISIIILVWVYKVATKDTYDSGDYSDFKKEQFGDNIVSGRDINDVTLFDEDPFTSSIANEYRRNNSYYDDLAQDINIPSKKECQELIDRLRVGDDFTKEEQSKLDECLENNLADLSEDDLKLLNMLNDDSISDEEKALIRKALSGQPLTKAEQALLDKLKRGEKLTDADKAILRAIQEKQRNGEDIPPSLDEALAKSITNGASGLTTDEKNAIDELVDSQLKDNEGGSVSGSDIQKAKDLANTIKKRQGEIESLESQIASKQAKAAPIYKKLSEGGIPTPEEQALLDEISRDRKRLQELKGSQESDKEVLSHITNKINNDLSNIVVDIKEVIPSDFEVVKSDIVKLKNKRKKQKKKPSKKIPKDPVEVDPVDDFYGDGGLLNIAQYGDDNNTADKSFVFSDKGIDNVVFPPGYKIPARLDTEIVVSSKGAGQIFEIEVLADIYHPKTGNLIIAKGSKASGKTQTFDAETGIMELQVSRFNAGSGEVENLALQVGSGDGKIGLKGVVTTNTGKYLAGAFITSFSSGVLNWFGQNILQEYDDSGDLNEALIGASLGGGAEVMEKIADLYAEKLKNAPEVFYAPKGVPIVLYPSVD